MKKLILLSILAVPMFYSIGCGPTGNTVVEEAPVVTEEMMAQEEEDMETTE
ncbi:MAG: hypothetical protein AB8B91_11685 [Rubripirellula sp.]